MCTLGKKLATVFSKRVVACAHCSLRGSRPEWPPTAGSHGLDRLPPRKAQRPFVLIHARSVEPYLYELGVSVQYLRQIPFFDPAAAWRGFTMKIRFSMRSREQRHRICSLQKPIRGLEEDPWREGLLLPLWQQVGAHGLSCAHHLAQNRYCGRPPMQR